MRMQESHQMAKEAPLRPYHTRWLVSLHSAPVNMPETGVATALW